MHLLVYCNAFYSFFFLFIRIHTHAWIFERDVCRLKCLYAIFGICTHSLSFTSNYYESLFLQFHNLLYVCVRMSIIRCIQFTIFVCFFSVQNKVSCIRIKTYCSISGCVVQFPLLDGLKKKTHMPYTTQDARNINRWHHIHSNLIIVKNSSNAVSHLNTAKHWMIYIWSMASVS